MEETMIMFSTRARIVGSFPDAMTWAHEIAGIVTKVSGVEVQVASRVGGHSDVLWVIRLENMAAVEKLMDQLQAAPDYDASIRQALAKGFFEPNSIEQALWRTV
jgi:hypothetical protein